MLDALLNIIIIVLLILIFYNYIDCDKSKEKIDCMHVCRKINKRPDCKNKDIPFKNDYNHIRQRSVRRDIDFIKKENNIKLDKYKKKIEENINDKIKDVINQSEQERIQVIEEEVAKLLLDNMSKKKYNLLDIENFDIKQRIQHANNLKNTIMSLDNINRKDIKIHIINEYLNNLVR
jgi:hypothetical protein